MSIVLVWLEKTVAVLCNARVGDSRLIAGWGVGGLKKVKNNASVMDW